MQLKSQEDTSGLLLNTFIRSYEELSDKSPETDGVAATEPGVNITALVFHEDTRRRTKGLKQPTYLGGCKF